MRSSIRVGVVGLSLFATPEGCTVPDAKPAPHVGNGVLTYVSTAPDCARLFVLSTTAEWLLQSTERPGGGATVVVQYSVDKGGAVVKRHISSSSGNPDFDKGALNSLSSCKLTPRSVNGVPTGYTTTMSYRAVWRPIYID